MVRVVVIIGGGIGIGVVCLWLMCVVGDWVFIIGWCEVLLQVVVDEIGVMVLVGDVVDGEVWCQWLLLVIFDQIGGIDVFICSVGGMGNSFVVEISDC